MKYILILIILLTLCLTAKGQYPQISYGPYVIILPQGTHMNTRVVVGPYRRHVRIGINTGFSSIPQVNTFNYVTGRQRQGFTRKN